MIRESKVLQESHIMILPSYSEGLPNSILEGMLYGMPVISRITGGIPDIIHEGVNGYLSESFEPSIFTDFINLLVTDKELYRKMALTNHHIALEKYTCEKVSGRKCLKFMRVVNLFNYCMIEVTKSKAITK